MNTVSKVCFWKVER